MPVANSLTKSCYYFNSEILSSQNRWKTTVVFLSRWCTCSHQLRLPPCPGLTTVPRPHRAARHSPLRQSASLTRRTSWFGPASSFLSSRCVCCCCSCLVSTYADERRHIPPSLLFEGRFQFAFTFLLAGTIGFRAVPVNSPPFPARVEQQQLGNIWPPQSARLPVPPPALLGSLLWKLVESQSSFVSGGKKEGLDGGSGEDVGPCCL